MFNADMSLAAMRFARNEAADADEQGYKDYCAEAYYALCTAYWNGKITHSQYITLGNNLDKAIAEGDVDAVECVREKVEGKKE